MRYFSNTPQRKQKLKNNRLVEVLTAEINSELISLNARNLSDKSLEAKQSNN